MNIKKLKFYRDVEKASFIKADFRELRTSKKYGFSVTNDHLVEFENNENIDILIGIFSNKELDVLLRDYFQLNNSDVYSNNIHYEFYWMYKITLTANLVPSVEYNKDVARFLNADGELMNFVLNKLLLLQSEMADSLDWDEVKSKTHLLNQLEEKPLFYINNSLNNILNMCIEKLVNSSKEKIDILLRPNSKDQIRVIRRKNDKEIINLQNFFLNDISKAISYEESGYHNKFINLFLENKFDKEEQSRKEILKTLQLTNNPLCRWPDSFDLNLLQQYSVNKYFNLSSEMYSVNGAPGTGKTTLLKHIFANIIFEKAKAMYKYKDRLFLEHDTLQSFVEKYAIVVASTTNRANENIVFGLPKRENFTDLPEDYNYLKTLQRKRDSIGLLAVPLGKKSNTEEFRKNFSQKKITKLDQNQDSDTIYQKIINIEAKIRESFKNAFTKNNFENIMHTNYLLYDVIEKVMDNPLKIETEVQEFNFTKILSKDIISLQNELFYLSLQLMEAIIIDKKHEIESILNNGVEKDIKNLYLTTIPITSTTLASTHSFFDTFEENSIGNVFIEEAGQATPQSTIGLLFRANKIMVIGDPFQLEPIVGITEELFNDLLNTNYSELKGTLYYNDSAQIFFDNVNRYGKYMSGQWVGAPLLVNRRNCEPMFSISNKLAYNNLMVRSSSISPISSMQTRVIDVEPCNGETKYCNNQMKIVFDSLLKYGSDDVFIITPFIEVKNGINQFLKANNIDLHNKLFNRIGTVHTFQGQEAKTVYLMLGKGGETFYNKKFNLLNVAVSRAKTEMILVTNKSANEMYDNMRIFYDNMDVTRS